MDDNLITALNEQNKEVCSERPWLEYLDIHDSYLNDDGGRNEVLCDKDGVDLNGEGYLIWIDALEEVGLV